MSFVIEKQEMSYQSLLAKTSTEISPNAGQSEETYSESITLEPQQLAW